MCTRIVLSHLLVASLSAMPKEAQLVQAGQPLSDAAFCDPSLPSASDVLEISAESNAADLTAAILDRVREKARHWTHKGKNLLELDTDVVLSIPGSGRHRLTSGVYELI